MELLLNIFWLTVALLAVGLWWRGESSSPCVHLRSRLPQFVILACVLILLFPVVSVTDDLHPLRPEMEESNPSKKIKNAADKSSNHPRVSDPIPAHVHACFSFSPQRQVCGQVLAELIPAPANPHFCKGASRAPPTITLT